MGLFNFHDLGETFSERCSVFNYKLHESSPEILLGLGIVTLLGAVVTSAFAGRKNDEIIEDHLNRVEDAKNEAIVTEDGIEVLNKKQVNSLVRREYMKTGWKFTRNYALSAFLTGCSILCFVKMHNIQAGWLNTLSVAYTGLQETFRRYQENNIALNGEQSHQMCKYGWKEIKECDEDGDITVKRVPKTAEEVAKDMGYNPEEYNEFYMINKDNCGLITGFPTTDYVALQGLESDIKYHVKQHGLITKGEIIKKLKLKDVDFSTTDLIMGIPKGMEDSFSLNIDAPVNNRFLALYPNEDVIIQISGLVNLHEMLKRKDAAQYLISEDAKKKAKGGQ